MSAIGAGLVGHPDNLLTNDPETFPLLQPGHSPRPSRYCCLGTDGSLWGRCLTTGRYLDNSQGWRHLSLVRAGPPKPEGGAPSLTRPCLPSQAAPASIWVPSALPLAKSMWCPWEQEKQPQGPAAADRPGFAPAGRAALMRTQHGHPAPIRWS